MFTMKLFKFQHIARVASMVFNTVLKHTHMRNAYWSLLQIAIDFLIFFFNIENKI